MPPPVLRSRTARSVAATTAAIALLGIPSTPALARSASSAPTGSAVPSSAPTDLLSDKAAAPKATFGIGPANAKKVDGRSYLYYLSTPGGRLKDHVAVVNIAAKPVTLNVYATDASNGTDGSFGYLARAAPRRGVASWIAITTPRAGSTITVGPRATMILPISVVVPSKATPGDHAAGVVVSLTSTVKGKTGQLVKFEQRLALRTFIRVSGPLHPELRIEGVHAGYAGTVNPLGRGTATVTYTVRNTGNVNLGGQQRITVSGLFGSTGPGRRLVDVPLLLPGSSVTRTVRVTGVFPQMRMTARVTVIPLKLPGDVDPGLPSQFTATSGFWAVPWTLIAAVVLLLAGLAALIWRRRRRRRPPPADAARHGTRTPEPVG